jgi:hypothetical protein
MAYIDGASSGKAIAALYATSGGSASTLLEQSSSVNIGTSFSWVDFKLPTSYSVNSGTTYGLAIMGNVQVNLMENPGTGQRDHNAVSTYTAGFANPFGMKWGTDNTESMTIYAVDPSTSGPAPTSAPTPTATPVSTPLPTPLPTATPPPTSTNLSPFDPSAVFSASPAWLTYNYYPESYSSIVHIDTSVVFNGQDSIRIDPHTSSDDNVARECDASDISISPGEEVIFSVWMLTSSSTIGDNNVIGDGARIGVDFYNNQYITGISWAGSYTPNPTYQQVVNNFVPWNTGTWTLRTLDFIVPSTVYDVNGVAHTPSCIIPWMQVNAVNDGGQAWFADPQLYIIP